LFIFTYLPHIFSSFSFLFSIFNRLFQFVGFHNLSAPVSIRPFLGLTTYTYQSGGINLTTSLGKFYMQCITNHLEGSKWCRNLRCSTVRCVDKISRTSLPYTLYIHISISLFFSNKTNNFRLTLFLWTLFFSITTNTCNVGREQ